MEVEEEEESKGKKLKHRANFDTILKLDPLNIKKGLIYSSEILISDKCPHCNKLTGTIYGGGLTTLFYNDCPIKRILLKRGWSLSNLEVKKEVIFDRINGVSKTVESGIAIIRKFTVPKTLLEKMLYTLNTNFSDELLVRFKELETLVDGGVNLFEERMIFYNVSKYGQLMYYYKGDGTPFISTRYTIKGETAVYEKTPDSEVEKMLFETDDYDIKRHQKFLEGKTYDWGNIIRKSLSVHNH